MRIPVFRISIDDDGRRHERKVAEIEVDIKAIYLTGPTELEQLFMGDAPTRVSICLNPASFRVIPGDKK